jgi:hypothetical protein
VGDAAIVDDGYDAFYAFKLWNRVPAVYRNLDSETLGEPGALEELLARLASQVATVRRSIDRLWEDQSIESCDDWVIPYIGDLVATNLVAGMDARGQRLDVANTIDYRRRKGTLGLVEQLSADLTGWEARAVEMFRRLGRTRHGLDPEFGRPADTDDPVAARHLQLAESLVGKLSGTPVGGTADIRNVLGGLETGTAFDEFAHRVDVRRGRGALGWYGIPKLGVFLWRHAVIGVTRATPVPVAGCDGFHFAFDPTGRQVALWAESVRGRDDYGDRWVSPEAWQAPGLISSALLQAVAEAPLPGPPHDAFPNPDATFWPESLVVRPLGGQLPLDQATVKVWPEVGRFAVQPGSPDVEVGFHYGLFSQIGAGPYDRRRLGVPMVDDPTPVTHTDGGTSTVLAAVLATVAPQGTVVIDDGLTSTKVSDVGSGGGPIQSVAVRGADGGRGVIRLSPGDPPWTLQGTPPGQPPVAQLRLEGLLLSGQDIALTGGFTSVTLSCCTFDPGSSGDLLTPPTIWGVTVDGRDLVPTRLWIDGFVETLVIDRCILGPIRTRGSGVIQHLLATDSVIQGLPASTDAMLAADVIFDPVGLGRQLRHGRDPLSAWLASQLTPASLAALTALSDDDPLPGPLLDALVVDLNAVIAGPLIWTAARFVRRALRPSTEAWIAAAPTGPELAQLNRQLLTEAYPVALADAAIVAHDGLTELRRCTLLGSAWMHRLECSESILDDVVTVEDVQDGCVRFSAWSSESALPRRYESVGVARHAALFASRRFGEATFAELLDSADAAIVTSDTAGAPSIRAGSAGGSEMGAYSREQAAVKERSLLIKFDEYLPVGLTPILIPVPGPDASGEKERARPWPPT